MTYPLAIHCFHLFPWLYDDYSAIENIVVMTEKLFVVNSQVSIAKCEFTQGKMLGKMLDAIKHTRPSVGRVLGYLQKAPGALLALALSGM